MKVKVTIEYEYEAHPKGYGMALVGPNVPTDEEFMEKIFEIDGDDGDAVLIENAADGSHDVQIWMEINGTKRLVS